MQVDVKQEAVVHITAVFRPSIAFHIWHLLDQETYPRPLIVSLAWEVDVQDSVEGLTAGSMPQAPFFELIARATPMMVVPAFALIRTSLQPLTLLLKVLDSLMLAATVFEVAGTMVPTRLRAEPRTGIERNTMSSQLKQEFSVIRPGSFSPQGVASRQIKLLSTMLLLKLAEFTSSISEQTPNTQVALGMLWQAIRGLTHTFAEHSDSQELDKEKQPENICSLAGLLVDVAQPMYCQMTCQIPAAADTCCKLMTALMQTSEQAVRIHVACRIAQLGEVQAHSSVGRMVPYQITH